MPPLVLYKCSVCRMDRNSYEDAEHCEATHLKAVSVKEQEYILGPYPSRVVLSFPDGTEHEYRIYD